MKRQPFAAAIGLLLCGCATVSPVKPVGDVSALVASRAGVSPKWTPDAATAAAVRGEVASLLAAGLTRQTAVRVAFLQNPALQAAFEDVGISQADLSQAARVANPELGAFARFGGNLSGANTEFSILQNVFDLFLRGPRRGIAEVDLARTKAVVAHEMLALAANVKTAFAALQADQELVARLRVIEEVAQTAADFAAKQHEAGTLGDLEFESHQALYRASRVDVVSMEATVRGDRERVNRLLGLWGNDTSWAIAEALPPLPPVEIDATGLESLAMRQRQDLAAARLGVDLVGRALALKRKTRFFPAGVHAGINTEKEAGGGPRVTGPEIALQLPVFDTGKASVARLEAEHRRAQRLLEAAAINARSEVREARDRMIASRDLARYYATTLVPQRQRILDLALRRYNAMLLGAYDVLLAKGEHVKTERAHVEAWRDYWIARADLERAVGGSLGEGNADGGSR